MKYDEDIIKNLDEGDYEKVNNENLLRNVKKYNDVYDIDKDG